MSGNRVCGNPFCYGLQKEQAAEWRCSKEAVLTTTVAPFLVCEVLLAFGGLAFAVRAVLRERRANQLRGIGAGREFGNAKARDDKHIGEACEFIHASTKISPISARSVAGIALEPISESVEADRSRGKASLHRERK
ncbi:MAG: hypothetical protein ABJC09_15865 [Terriglobia bacterium]